MCVLSLFCAGRLAAQNATAEIVGTVNDASGAAMPNAHVTAKHIATGVARSMDTNAAGAYSFTFVPIGIYSVTIAAKGFKTFTAHSISIATGDVARVDAKMELGDMQQTVEVQAQAAAALQTDSSSVTSYLTKQNVQDLPVNGRNITKLVQLLPGVNEGTTSNQTSGNRPGDKRQTSSISVNGQSDVLNTQLIDGMDNNERMQGAMGIKPSIEAIEEVQVQTNLYSAAVSRTAGGVVNLVTKSGTNKPHGSLFEYVRNSMFDAKDFFNVPQAGNALAGVQPKYRLNQFGGSVGGSVKKDKTFFFMDYELLLTRQGVTQSVTVPTPCELGRKSCNGVMQLGNFFDMLPGKVIYDPLGAGKPTPFPNNLIPITRINSIAQNYAALWPVSNVCTATSPTCQFVDSPVQTQTFHTADIRIDHHFNDKQYLFARYSVNNVDTFIPSALPQVSVASKSLWPGGSSSSIFPGSTVQRFQNVALSYTHIFRPTLLMQLSGSYLRIMGYGAATNSGTNAATAFGWLGANTDATTSGLPQLTFNDGGYQILGDATNLPIFTGGNNFSYTGTVTWTKGVHTVKFGASLTRRRADFYQSQYTMGQFSFSSQLTNSTLGASGGSGGSSLASLLLGYPLLQQRTLALGINQNRNWEPNGYVQDDWRITSRLTLNLGLRWDAFTPITEKHDHLSNFDVTDPSVLAGGQVLVAGQNGVSRTVNFVTPKHDFQPRLGFAATLGHDTVLRGGFGMTYYPNMVGTSNSLRNQPFLSTFVNIAPLGQPGVPLPVLGTPLPTAPSSTCLVASCGATGVTLVQYAIDRDRPDNQAYQTNLVIEKGFAGNIAGIGYAGVFGRHMGVMFPNVNLPLPPLGPGGCGQTTAIAIPGPCQPYYKQIPLVVDVQMVKEGGIANYNSLQLTLKRRYQHGLTLAASYTYARGLSDGFDGARGVCNSCGLKLNDPSFDYGNSDLDIRHRVAVTANYEVPGFKSAKGPLAGVLNGWQVNGIYLYSTGLPFTVVNTGSPQSNIGQGGIGTTVNVSGDRPNRRQSSSFTQSLNEWFDITAFALQPYGTMGNEGRNQFYSPRQTRVDVSLFKEFSLKESVKLQFRAEAYNLTNTPSFAPPSANISGWTSTNSAGVPTTGGNFGKITATSFFYTPRDLQFALKLRF
jgi:hypothetical protein